MNTVKTIQRVIQTLLKPKSFVSSVRHRLGRPPVEVNERTNARFPEALGLETRSQAATGLEREEIAKHEGEGRGEEAGGREGESARQKGRARLGAIINDAATLRSPGSSLGFTPLTFVAA